MTLSLAHMTHITNEVINSRLIVVKSLHQDLTESYDILKDQETGEHYLHYLFKHRNIAEGGREEILHHYMPIDNDDVLACVLGEQEYRYPSVWNTPYLRSGGDQGDLVWFDPTGLNEQQQYENTGRKIQERLETFKQKGEINEDAIRRLLDDMDNL